MNIRRLVLDVDKAIARPSVIEIAEAIESTSGVEATNVQVTEIDLETVGMNVTIQGAALNYEAIVKAIEDVGAVVHSIDEIATGTSLIENAKRAR